VNVDKASDSWPLGGDGISDFDELKPYLDEVNAHIAASSASHGVLVAPVYQAFNGVTGDEDPGDKGLTAFDDFHPNGLGHAVIASLLRGLGYATVTP
jgi:lysophospholipase L1-like esterase